jgi:hypothetical protein
MVGLFDWVSACFVEKIASIYMGFDVHVHVIISTGYRMLGFSCVLAKKKRASENKMDRWRKI